MNVQSITMDPEEAAAQLEGYVKMLRRRADAEYEQVKGGLEQLAAGHALLDLGDTIRNAPVDSKGRPRLAIARSDRRQVMAYGWGTNVDFITRWRGPGSESPTTRIRVDVGRPTNPMPSGYALVPLVPPPGLRLAGGFTGLRKHFTLFEVEAWSDAPRLAQPDRDPYLLRHVAGELYAVIYEWDLTELERAVMAGRREG